MVKPPFELDVLKEVLNPILGTNCIIQPVDEGVSTYVFKVSKEKETFYLRITRDKTESFDAEVLVHKDLHKRGVKVPEVLFYENYNSQIDRSYMVVKEVKGSSLKKESDEGVLRNCLYEAGEQIAVVNQIPIKKFGWIQRYGNNITNLVGMDETYADYLFGSLEKNLSILETANIIDSDQVISIQKIPEHFPEYFSYTQGFLAHADFDVSCIYENEGKYTGIIDFGDIRSTDQYTDLGHFYNYSPEKFEYLLNGYKTVINLPDDFMLRMQATMLFFLIQREVWMLQNIPHDAYHNKTIKGIKTYLQNFNRLS
jgi:aminoglycoside phosphotransferase (APT) family kinase protein